jgi:hypothetical protein
MRFRFEPLGEDHAAAGARLKGVEGGGVLLSNLPQMLSYSDVLPILNMFITYK